jgi:A/G-specific adenine glycosylase
LKKLIIKGMGRRYFSDKIVKWYLDHKRSLPWRDTTDPYRIWLSEVILQQTRVNQGLSYYQQFVRNYPAVTDLAKASEQQILRLWQGLGYYSRARNLHKCAKTVVEFYNGNFPKTYKELLALPGIGDYTAAAIASFAFGEAVAVVDANVFRVLSRIFGIDAAIDSAEGKKRFTWLAGELLSLEEPALHNQAAMEFGALFCTPRIPKCPHCPFKTTCFAYNNDLVHALPVTVRSKKTRKRYFFYLVVEKDKALLMKKREQKDIWQGLFDFVLIEKNRPVKPENLIRETELLTWIRKPAAVKVSRKYKHILSHQTIHCRFLHVKADPSFHSPDPQLSFYSPVEVANLPKPVLITKFLEERNTH